MSVYKLDNWRNSDDGGLLDLRGCMTENIRMDEKFGCLHSFIFSSHDHHHAQSPQRVSNQVKQRLFELLATLYQLDSTLFFPTTEHEIISWALFQQKKRYGFFQFDNILVCFGTTWKVLFASVSLNALYPSIKLPFLKQRDLEREVCSWCLTGMRRAFHV